MGLPVSVKGMDGDDDDRMDILLNLVCPLVGDFSCAFVGEVGL